MSKPNNHFIQSGPLPPQNPKLGDHWLDTRDFRLHRWSGYVWVSLSSAVAEVTMEQHPVMSKSEPVDLKDAAAKEKHRLFEELLICNGLPF